MRLLEIQKTLRSLASPDIAEHSQRFFKTGKGEYGEGDRFLGIRVPVLRKQAKIFQDMPLKDTERLLQSRFHEERLCALLILVLKFKSGNAGDKTSVYKLYLCRTKYINNWDLVDSSAHYIVGAYLSDSGKGPLYKLAKSRNLWERRIAIMSTFYFIKNSQFEDALELSYELLHDEEDLIHKAVGWMLREIGNRDIAAEERFLQAHYKEMPRTMLRYAIEKFPERKRKSYLAGLR